jgi:hypothetical protein
MVLTRLLQKTFAGFAERVGASSALDPVAARLHALAEPVFGSEGNQSLKDALYGTWLGHPLHPAMTDLPIGFWTSSFVLDLAGMERGADITLKLGTVSALGTASPAMPSGTTCRNWMNRAASAPCTPCSTWPPLAATPSPGSSAIRGTVGPGISPRRPGCPWRV